MMRWYNTELAPEIAVGFKSFLKERHFSYETSQADNLIHFEVLLSPDDVEECNREIDRLIAEESGHEE